MTTRAMTLDAKTIENVRGSMEDDKLTGDGEANKLYGNHGRRRCSWAGTGDDTIRGGKDDDEIDGGDGRRHDPSGDMGDDMLTGGRR